MKFSKTLAIFLSVLSAVPVTTAAETYKESFECEFGRGLVNRPTPERLVFSIDEFGRSALLHEVEIPKIDTYPGSGKVGRDTPKLLSISWVGSNYVYSASGRTYASNENRYDAIDLLDLEFSITLNRKSMTAIAKSRTYGTYLPRDGFARGRCKLISAPK
ncbi:hypothetical protein [Ruegeria atlantica]|uniref:hypothetical protein n=1 Tax=Ruegeria atlantica TaxID=81569 RepID=UPI001480E1ED|nr:hypothetical protein [Ruegeria atlantica]